VCTYLVRRDSSNCSAVRRSPFVLRNAARCNSHLDHILQMVEPARGTEASDHDPWGVYATAWELGWATNTPPQSCTALPTSYSTARKRCHECHTVVRAPSSAARAAMGHWGNAPTSRGWWGTAWSPSGAKDSPQQPHSALPTHRIRGFKRFGWSYGGVHTIFSS
jgi:hypothetical protein